jgi:hypothetical protein
MSKSKAGAHAAQPKQTRASDEAAPPNTGTCRKCSHTMPVALMAKAGKGKHSTLCRHCDNARQRARYWANPEAARAKRRELRLRNLEKERARGRERARSPRGRELNRAAVKRYQQKYPARVAAQAQARAAAKRGEIKVPSVCQVLGCGCKDGLHLHHRRYDKPRDVIAVCRLHHEEIHHRGPLRLMASAERQWARAPRTEVTGRAP